MSGIDPPRLAGLGTPASARLAEAAARQAKPWRDGPPKRGLYILVLSLIPKNSKTYLWGRFVDLIALFWRLPTLPGLRPKYHPTSFCQGQNFAGQVGA